MMYNMGGSVKFSHRAKCEGQNYAELTGHVRFLFCLPNSCLNGQQGVYGRSAFSKAISTRRKFAAALIVLVESLKNNLFQELPGVTEETDRPV